MNRPIPAPRAVIFDWDNTLVDSWEIIHDAMNVTLERFGHAPWTLDETRARVRKSMRDSFPGLFGERWQEAADVFYERFHAIHVERLRPLPYAEEMLADLAAREIYLGLVSNKIGDTLRTEVRHLGWDRFFGGVVGATDAERDKPAVEPVRLALRAAGLEPGEGVWFAGDSNIDLECARNAGCLAVLIRETPPAEGEFDDHPPHRHVADCRQFGRLVRENVR